jgi:hypothetical protein
VIEMSELEIKFNSLDSQEQKIIIDMINLLMQKKGSHKFSDYKKKILTISTWTEEDLKVYEENKITSWNVPTW